MNTWKQITFIQETFDSRKKYIKYAVIAANNKNNE